MYLLLPGAQIAHKTIFVQQSIFLCRGKRRVAQQSQNALLPVFNNNDYANSPVSHYTSQGLPCLPCQYHSTTADTRCHPPSRKPSKSKALAKIGENLIENSLQLLVFT